MQNIQAAGLITASALYLAGCIAFGIAIGNHGAVQLAIMAAGVAYLCYATQIGAPKHRGVAMFLNGVSIASGVLSGIILLRAI